MTHVWLAKDPETGRVTAQARDWQDGDFPPGLRGQGWERRELDVEDDTWRELLDGRRTPREQDDLHLDWWARA